MGHPTLARLPGFLPNENASPFHPQKRRLVKKKKGKKEVQEDETDERSRWGVGAGTGQEVYGSLTLVFSRLCFCSHQHKHAKCEAVFHTGSTASEKDCRRTKKKCDFFFLIL